MERLIGQKTKRVRQAQKPVVHTEIREDGERYGVFALSMREGEGQ